MANHEDINWIIITVVKLIVLYMRQENHLANQRNGVIEYHTSLLQIVLICHFNLYATISHTQPLTEMMCAIFLQLGETLTHNFALLYHFHPFFFQPSFLIN